MASRAELSSLSLIVALLIASSARAQTEADGWAPPEGDRPTSGDASLLSGRTLGTGEVLIAAAIGFPGLWAHVEIAPSSDFNLGVRAGVLYGSPNMGLGIGGGGQLEVPMRIHLWGEGEGDLALRLCPRIAVGEGALFGESGIFAHVFGLSSRLDAGVLLGWHPDPRVTLFVGADAGIGLSYVEGTSVEPIGVFQGRLGVEGLLARDTMLFAELTVGGGLAPEPRGVPLYPDRFALGLSLGLGYLL